MYTTNERRGVNMERRRCSPACGASLCRLDAAMVSKRTRWPPNIHKKGCDRCVLCGRRVRGGAVVGAHPIGKH